MTSAVARPHPSRCDPHRADYDEIVRAHELAVSLGLPSYRDPASGLMVLCVTTHLVRGTCCDSGCRHCPFILD